MEKDAPYATLMKDDEAKLTSFSNVQLHEEHSHKWYVVGSSSIGKAHIMDSLPCQDNHFISLINKDFGIAIVCDGAGSVKNSAFGSRFVTRNGYEVFKDAIEKTACLQSDTLLEDSEWSKIARESLSLIYQNLCSYGKSENFEPDTLACTIIVLVFSRHGLMITHIGDGRAAFRNYLGEWKSVLCPHKGEEANQTIFITSEYWKKDNAIMSGVNVPESTVIRESLTAFCLMSDGCEMHSFECNIIDSLTNKWHDPNKPFSGFFNPVFETLSNMYRNRVSIQEANKNWQEFISEGTVGLKNESDDKTMIIGIMI